MLSVVSGEFDPKCHFREDFGTFQLRAPREIQPKKWREPKGGDVVLLFNFFVGRIHQKLKVSCKLFQLLHTQGSVQ